MYLNFCVCKLAAAGVMPPDEHAENVNNSVYTNVVASYAVHFARYAACLAGADPIQQVPDRSEFEDVMLLVFIYLILLFEGGYGTLGADSGCALLINHSCY